MNKTKSRKPYNELLQLTAGSWIPVLDALRDAGFDLKTLSRIQSDPAYAAKFGAVVANSGIPTLPAEEIRIRESFGDSQYGIAGVRELSEHFWVYLTESQLANFPTFPWPIELLDEPCPFTTHLGKCREDRTKYITIRETHQIFLGLDKVKSTPLTPLMLQKLANKSDLSSYHAGNRVGRSDFYKKEHAQFRWYMIYRDAIYESRDKSHQEQKAMLPPEYEEPNSIEVALGHYLTGGSSICGLSSIGTSTIVTPEGESSEYRVVMGQGSNDDPYYGFRLALLEITQRDGISASRIPGR